MQRRLHLPAGGKEKSLLTVVAYDLSFPPAGRTSRKQFGWGGGGKGQQSLHPARTGEEGREGEGEWGKGRAAEGGIKERRGKGRHERTDAATSGGGIAWRNPGERICRNPRIPPTGPSSSKDGGRGQGGGGGRGKGRAAEGGMKQRRVAERRNEPKRQRAAPNGQLSQQGSLSTN